MIGTKRNFIWFRINRKMVNILWFQLIWHESEVYFPACTRIKKRFVEARIAKYGTMLRTQKFNAIHSIRIYKS